MFFRTDSLRYQKNNVHKTEVSKVKAELGFGIRGARIGSPNFRLGEIYIDIYTYTYIPRTRLSFVLGVVPCLL